jgi:hypothetical protein
VSEDVAAEFRTGFGASGLPDGFAAGLVTGVSALLTPDVQKSFAARFAASFAAGFAAGPSAGLATGLATVFASGRAARVTL